MRGGGGGVCDSSSLPPQRSSTHCLINTTEYLTCSPLHASQDEEEEQRCQEAKYHVRRRLTAIASNDESTVQTINWGTEE